MGLQVWLPLNGNLNQQGLANVAVSNNGATVNTAGKIGSCYSFSGNSLYGDWSEINTLTQISGCCWVYLNNLNSAQYFFHLGGQSSYPCKFSLDYEGSIRFQINGTEYTSGITLTTGIWYHLAITWNGTMAKLYVNGIESYSKSATGSFSASNHFAIGARTNGTAGNTFGYAITNGGKLNDIRFYDHCLSPREVKEISKGLVLHYSLAMPGQENLQQGTTSIGATNVPGWVSNGGGTTLEKIDGNIIHFKRTISDSKVIPTIALNCVAPCDFNSSYVYSIDLKFDRDIITTGSTPAHFWCGARNTDSIFNTSCNGNLSNRSSSIISPSASTVIPANTWYTQKVRINFGDGPTSEGYDYPAIRCFVYGGVLSENYTGEVNGWMKNCKVEKGTVATPWIPNPADAEYSTLGFDDGIEYDVSGYGHNGTKVGTITYDADTPRYNTSAVLDGSYITLTGITDQAIPQFSVCGWVNLLTGYTANYGCHLINFSKTYCRICVSKDNSAVRLLLTDGTTNYSGSSAMASSSLSANVWNHYAVTFDNGSIKIYINGELDSSRTATITSISPSTPWTIGNYGTSEFPKAKVSDVRFYTTALSADDILELYHAPITLANNGTLLTQGEFEES